MEQPTNVQMKMLYGDNIKVTTIIASERDEQLSSFEDFKKLILRNFPDVEKKLSQSSGWFKWELVLQYEDDGGLISIESDEDLRHAWRNNSKMKFLVDIRKQAAVGRSSLNSKQLQGMSKMSPCRFYSGPGTCRNGKNCTFSHEGNINQSSFSVRPNTPRPCRYFSGPGTCRNGRECTFLHQSSHSSNCGSASSGSVSTLSAMDRSSSWGRQQIKSRTSEDTVCSANSTKTAVVDKNSWLKQQIKLKASENIEYLSGEEGFAVLLNIVSQADLSDETIRLFVVLLAKQQFRLSLMRERTNKVYGALVGSLFSLQLLRHITSDLGAATPEEVLPYLHLAEELQSRTSNGWKEVPLDSILNVIMTLEDDDKRDELLSFSHRLIDYRKKLQRQAAEAAQNGQCLWKTDFRSLSIIPDKSELLQAGLSEDLPVNQVGLRYSSVTKYLETHFLLLREDCFHPLRQGIKAYQQNQDSGNLRIYRNVNLVGYGCGEIGLEYVMESRAQLPVEASKRFRFGSLLCISDDDFRTSFVLGVITKSDITDQNRHGQRTVWIRVQGEYTEAAPLKSDSTYVMVESSRSYFEAYCHVLKTLQRKEMEDIPFTRYLLQLEPHVKPPAYLLGETDGDYFDFESSFPTMTTQDWGPSHGTFHILKDWPHWKSSLDDAQMQALKHGLTKELSVIQGPPGTGKTYLGLLLVKLLLANFKADPWKHFEESEELSDLLGTLVKETRWRRGPILVVCMTNHALDQFLGGILHFNQNLIRIGGRSKSKPLEKYNIRHLLQQQRINQSLEPSHHRARRNSSDKKSKLGNQIYACKEALSSTMVKSVQQLTGIATEEQIRQLSFEHSIEAWLAGVLGSVDEVHREDDSGFTYVGRKVKFLPLDRNRRRPDLDHTEPTGIWRGNANEGDFTVGDVPQENQFDLLVELGDNINAEPDGGNAKSLHSNPGSRPSSDGEQGEIRLEDLINNQDVWSLPMEQRRVLHDYWLDGIHTRHMTELQRLLNQYETVCKEVRDVEDEIQLWLLRMADVVGITTTCAARYHRILSALDSEIVIVEEAAEVLEGHVLASLTPSVEHLILIGDHLQLRPSVSVTKLAKKHKLEVSMFERLVRGGVEYVTLLEQRRMRPSISKLVRCLYPQLKDHDSVYGYEDVRGVASNLFFFDHTAMESSQTAFSSKVNITEANLVVELALYLLKQDCYLPEDITILTMYTGQIMQIEKILKERGSSVMSKISPEQIVKSLSAAKDYSSLDPEEDNEEEEMEKKMLPRVRSVDDYQGEENKIIILSLVRSNNMIHHDGGEGTIGFLEIENRTCVALTRAKEGMFIFGNATLLAERSNLWKKVTTQMRDDGALDTELVLYCQNHPETRTRITKEEDFNEVRDGGCSKSCETQLKCGHVCPRRCHPGSHVDVICPKPCSKELPDCAHTCPSRCHDDDHCPPCEKRVPKILPSCHHTQTMKCSVLAKYEKCKTPCPRLLICGHNCRKLCGSSFCTDECGEPVCKTLPCGHEATMSCARSDVTFPCPKPCQAILPDCGHACEGTCGKCKNGEEHIPCQKPCGRTLPCGHDCKAGCSAPCPPCREKCQKRCMHSKCARSCGEMCTPCLEPCLWQCDHHQCDLRCYEICMRPRCDFPCLETLQCGHPCIGLCGDPCPQKCRICHPTTFDIITQMTLEEYEETDRFVQLVDCKHLFEVGGLDTWMDADDTQGEHESKSAAIKLRECPECKSIIWRSTRYANVIKSKQATLEGVKLKMNGYDLVTQGHEKLEVGDSGGAIADFKEALKRNSGLMEAHLGLGLSFASEVALRRYFVTNCAIYKHARDHLSVVVLNSSYANELRDVVRPTLDILKLFRPQDSGSLRSEVEIKAILQLASIFTMSKDFDKAERLCTAITSRHPNRPDALEALENVQKGVILMAVQVMSKELKGPGRWYQCPNGHYYTIGECGGAMETSKCPDCSAQVGGARHQLSSGNRHSNIDGSSQSAWPGQ